MNVQNWAQAIFTQKNLTASIMVYLKVVSEIDSKIEKPVSQDYKSAVQLLEQAKNLSSPNLSHGILLQAAERFNIAIMMEKYERLLLCYLGLMLCYHHLGKEKEIRQIQQKVFQEKFNDSFWKKHKSEITEGAMMLLGAAMAFASRGAVSPGAGAAIGGQTGSKLHEDMREREEIFNQLRNAILGL